MVPVMPFVTRWYDRFQIKPCHSRHDVEANLSLNAHRLKCNRVRTTHEAVCANAKTDGGARCDSTV